MNIPVHSYQDKTHYIRVNRNPRPRVIVTSIVIAIALAFLLALTAQVIATYNNNVNKVQQ